MLNEITIGKIRYRGNIDDSAFLKAYEKLQTNCELLSYDEKFYLLKLAILFLNSTDKEVVLLGYCIILRYSNKFKDYGPLYDVAMSRSYIPITKFIENKYLVKNAKQSFSDLYLSAYQENFKIRGDNNHIYRSLGQMILNKFSECMDNIAIVAPTSYGKSEMIIAKIQAHLTEKICIVVPSKALLAQTRKGLMRNEIIRNHFGKIITHPDMFRNGDSSFLAVLTQERLLRLLQKNKQLALDLVMVDEAHNILENGKRAHLLAQVLLILKNRKKLFLVNFFTPFLCDVKNLNITNTDIDIKGKPIDENMKIEKFFAYDLNKNEKYLYDQFLNRPFPLNVLDFESDIDFISHHKSEKNIIYLNRPVKAEEVAMAMARTEGKIIITEAVQKIVDSISDLIHPDYNLIQCIKGGVVYHHAGIPDVVRLFVEDIFSTYLEFKYIVTTSTLLEGVNIPAEKIFVLTPKKGPGNLTDSQFKNLVGRVCRFKEIFDIKRGDLKLLEPEIYLIKGNYAPGNFALLNFYSTRVNSSRINKDIVKNPLLKNSENQAEAKEVLEYLENMEPGSSGLTDVASPRTEIGKLCFENNVYDFNIIKSEVILNKNLNTYDSAGNEKINNAGSLIEGIYEIFLKDVKLNDKAGNIIRLQNEPKARNFYAMFIGWRAVGAPYPLMIGSFLRYWKKIEQSGETIIFVGSQRGDITHDGHQKLWVDISKKTEIERINLAIAKIKEEQEFVDFNIIKFVEILNDLNVIDGDFYNQVKYGTANKYMICMLKNGFSMELSKIFVNKYFEHVEFNFRNDSVYYSKALINDMIRNNENEILIFEARNSMH